MLLQENNTTKKSAALSAIISRDITKFRGAQREAWSEFHKLALMAFKLAKDYGVYSAFDQLKDELPLAMRKTFIDWVCANGRVKFIKDENATRDTTGKFGAIGKKSLPSKVWKDRYAIEPFQTFEKAKRATAPRAVKSLREKIETLIKGSVEPSDTKLISAIELVLSGQLYSENVQAIRATLQNERDTWNNERKTLADKAKEWHDKAQALAHELETAKAEAETWKERAEKLFKAQSAKPKAQAKPKVAKPEAQQVAIN